MKHMLVTVMAFSAWPAVALAHDAPLATGTNETLLHIVATGEVRNRADFFALKVTIKTSAPTAAAAREANKIKIAKLKGGLASIGIAGDAVISGIPALGFVGNMPVGEEGEAINLVSEANARTRSASSFFEIRAADSSQLSKVEEVLDTQDLSMIGLPQPSLDDDSSAWAAAIAAAVAKARQQADVYASSLDLKVGRIVRVSNGCSSINDDPAAAMARWSTMWGGGGVEVVTSAVACLDIVAVTK